MKYSKVGQFLVVQPQANAAEVVVVDDNAMQIASSVRAVEL